MVYTKHKERPIIVVSLSSEREAFWRAFFDMAREFEWRVHDIDLDKGLLAPDLHPKGAVLNSFADDLLVTQLKEMGCHCVRNGNYPHPLDEQMPAIMPDSKAMGRMAAAHFSSRGLKHVGCIVNEPSDDYNLMPDGMRQEAERLGMEYHELRKPRFAEMKMVMADLLKGLPRPIGISGYPTHVLKLIRSIENLGWQVPQDAAVLCPIDSLQCEASVIPVSAIELDLAAQGRHAAQILKQMMAGEDCPPCTMVPPKGVVLRQSTDTLAVSDPSVAQALQYIWEYYHWPLTVDDVALEVKTSRSTIQRRFRQYLGRSVNDEIRRKRLEECGKLLRSTTKSLADIAKLVGLRNRGYLHKAFTKAYGMSPGQYRDG